MADKSDLIDLIRIPILIAFAVTIARAAAEVLGAPSVVVLVLGVAWLHVLFPIYFASKISALGFERPFIALIKATILWAVPVRVVVAITYVVGYVYQIDSVRFQPQNLGPLGEDVTPLQGFLLLPLANFASWMLMAVVLAAITGGVTLKLKKPVVSTLKR